MSEQDLKNEIQIVDQFRALVVNSQETYEEAAGHIVALEGLAKKIKDYWKEPKERAFQAHRAITAKEAEMLKPVEDAKKTVRQKVSGYLTEIERRRREEQARLDRERAERERKEREKLAKAAARAEEKGQDEKADDLRNKAADVYVPPAFVEPVVEKTVRTDAATISQKKDINVTVTSVKALCALVAAGTVPEAVIKVDNVKLKQFVKLSQLERLDGCVIESVVTAQVRTA